MISVERWTLLAQGVPGVTSSRMYESVFNENAGEYEMSDLRKHKRSILCYHCEVRERESDRLVGYLADISESGMMLFCDHPVELDEVLHLEVDFSEDMAGEKNLELTGKCRRRIEDTRLKSFNIGFELLEIDNQSRQMIDRLSSLFEFDW